MTPKPHATPCDSFIFQHPPSRGEMREKGTMPKNESPELDSARSCFMWDLVFHVLLLCLCSLAFSGPSSLQQGFLEVLQFLFCSTALSCRWQCPGLKAILVSLLDLLLHHLHKLLKLHLINVTFFFLWFNQHFALWSYLLFTQYC